MEKQQNRKCICWFFVILFCITVNIGFAQIPPPPGSGCTINGSSSVPWGTVTTYTLSGSGCSATGWSVSCGTVQSFTTTTALIDFNGSYSCTTATVSALGTTATKSVTITVPPLVGGTINNPSQVINYNTTPAQITATAPSGGECGSFSYQWYSSPNNSSFSSISGATSQYYQPPALTSTTYYKRDAICGSLNAYTTNTATVTVYPQLIPGNAYMSDDPINNETINYNTNAGGVVVANVSGGSGTYAYQWQNSLNNSIWTPISGATTTGYTIGNLSITTYYNVAVTSNGVTLNSTSYTVTVNPQVLPGLITQSYLTIDSGASPGEIEATVASGGGCGGIYLYQWQNSIDGVNFTTISGATAQNYTPGTLTVNTWYRRQVNCSADIEYTNVSQITVASTNTSLNFTRMRSVLKAGVTDTVTADGLTSPFDVAQTTQYFDGIGRLVQTVSNKSSPLQNDVVQSVVYDNFGRQSDQYLPYVASANDGNYKPTAIADQLNFNSAQFPGEQYYYGELEFEASPLNRVLTSFSPGISWIGNNTGISTQYLMNAASDSVQIWNISSVQMSLPVNGGPYQPGQLYKNVIIDEEGHQLIEYKDKIGKIILKKLQLASSPSTGHAGWLNTYYVYDTLQNLRVIIQPQGVALINGSWSISQNIANELCFRYEYDGRKRMVIKRVPGAGQVWMVYDARNRLAMSQDSALRSIQKWMFMKYDSEDRPDSTGFITDPTNYNNLAYHDTLAYHSTNYPIVSSYTNELLTMTFYDDYSWVSNYSAPVSASMAANYTSNSNYFITSYNTSPAYAVQITPFAITRGMSTGFMKKVVGTSSQYLYTSNFYDDRGRVIQAQSVNYTGAIDTTTMQYNFDGAMLRILQNHKKNNNTVQGHIVVTKMDYDQAFRLRHIWKNIDGAATDQLIDSMQYNELGLLNAKYVGNNIDSLIYSYNIRGWLTGINKNYIAGSTNHYFGMEIGYDKTTSVAPGNSYVAPEFNGNIEGIVWKSGGDGVNRKYDFTYDNANRLSTAAFLQNTSGTAWDKNYLDFSVSGLSYDANGNIMTMTQRGFTVGGSSAVDSLTYSYLNTNTSNKLMGVVDAANNPTSLLGDFHYNQTTKQSTDYTYDGNGNLLTDNNKAIDKTTYNYLNLPQLVHMNTKGNIAYTYDAGGSKLSKVVTDSTVRHSITTLYICGFEYQQTDTITSPGGGIDTLQFIAHEEGRVRWAYHKYTTGSAAYKFEYDFFEKDNLGNTRMVLTQEKDTSNYLASMEAAYRTTESQLFSNITTTCYARASVSGYPDDLTYTNPNDSVSKVDYTGTSGQKTGPSLLLKVMSGDTVKFGVQSYYNSGTGGTNNSSFTDVLNSLANALFSSTGGSHGTVGNLEASNSTIYSGLTNFLSTDDPPPTGFPKAYLNWIFLDDQFNYVSSLSGSVQAASSTYPSAHLNTVAPGSQLALTKSGYLYIWVSNETQGWDVFFDNLSIQYKQGPLLEMNNYYPFGLTMQGLSDKAVKPQYAENKCRYDQGTELQNKEFSDGTGLEMYETSFRGLDPQLGRFSQIDPMADRAQFSSAYSFAANNPVSSNDPTGLLKQSPQTIGTMNYFQSLGAGGGSDVDESMDEADDLTSYGMYAASFTNNSGPYADFWNDVIDAISLGATGSWTSDGNGMGIGTPTVLEAALMSEYVYGSAKISLTGGWQPSSLSIPGLITSSSDGLQAQLFEKVVDGQTVGYCFAFAGTQDFTDAVQDIESEQGLSTQFKDAAIDAQVLSTAGLSAPLTFTGHSLGGGLASLAALETGDNAITFNALGISNATLNAYGVNGQSQNNITAMIVTGDPLNIAQQGLHFLNPNYNTAAGNQQPITSTIFSLNPFTYHSIDTIIQSLENHYEIRLW